MTHAMQPLDVYGFAPFKAYLRRRYREEQLRTAQPVLRPSQAAALVGEAATTALPACNWDTFFDRCGYGRSQALVKTFLLEQLGAGAPPAIAAGAPSAEELALCLPRRRRIEPSLLRHAGHDVPTPPALAIATPPPLALTWHGRTRSTTSRPSSSDARGIVAAPTAGALLSTASGSSGPEPSGSASAPGPIARRTRSRLTLD